MPTVGEMVDTEEPTANDTADDAPDGASGGGGGIHTPSAERPMQEMLPNGPGSALAELRKLHEDLCRELNIKDRTDDPTIVEAVQALKKDFSQMVDELDRQAEMIDSLEQQLEA